MKKKHVPFFPNIAPLLSPTFSFLSTAFRGYLQLPRTNEAKEAKIKRRRERTLLEKASDRYLTGITETSREEDPSSMSEKSKPRLPFDRSKRVHGCRVIE